MATGYKDYRRTVAPINPVLGDLQGAVGDADVTIISAVSDGTVYNYEVPAGYILNPLGIIISCNYPAINRAAIFIGDKLPLQIYFDSYLIVPLGSIGAFPIIAGKSILIIIYNNFFLDTTFFTNFWGFLEKST